MTGVNEITEILGDRLKGRVLKNRQDILDYYEISPGMFKIFIEMGMPARVIGNRWYAHTDNIDEWLKKITAVSMKKIPEGAD